MTVGYLLILSVICFLSSCGLTWLFRRYALRIRLLDHPNARSSHVVPTPRGGGVAFVVTTLLAVVVCASLVPNLRPLAAALLGGGLIVALLGYIDDRHHLPSRWRLLGHLASGTWVLAWLGPIPPVPILGVAVPLGPIGLGLSLLHLVWMINLSNFMDGIDGVASTQAITCALGGAWLWWLVTPGQGWMFAVLLAACVCGFLVWNWPPARIFMGDSGSGFLGFMLGALSLWSGQEEPRLFWAWFILFGCFMVDATTTLVRRVAQGARFDEAHRTHAYQHASRKCGRHLPVTVAVAAINLFWLLPLALAVALGHLDGVLGVAIAYAPLVALAHRLGAGRPEPARP